MNEESGLVACGKYGSWDVEIHEVEYDSGDYYTIIISHLATILQFTISDISILGEIVRFLDERDSSDVTYFPVKLESGAEARFISDASRLSIRYSNSGNIGGTDLFELKFNLEEKIALKKAIKDALDDL